MHNLTENQLRALELARGNGGELRLYDHGRWKGRITGMNTEAVKGSTVDSLARRGLLKLMNYRLGKPTRAVLSAVTDEPNKPAPVERGICTRCCGVRVIVGETWNGQKLCGGCIDEMKGVHLGRVVPNKRGYGLKGAAQ